MIDFISGKVADINENVVVLENNGIGYEITVSMTTLVGLTVGQTVSVFVYLQVREDGYSLFGFANKDEKRMFLRLISVSGVGPKVALSVLSGVGLRELAMAILNNDTATLTRVKGLGKKTAERIILELKEKISPTEAIGAPSKSTETTAVSSEGEEAIAVLTSLGLTVADATQRVKKCIEEGYVTAESILSHALKG
ncbi:MAG: Holliday junction branch migration protein RuvA [Eubacteriales bacterium]|nr:Holliday junction branch migration protein RuvA [Eubacteriales bacterium]